MMIRSRTPQISRMSQISLMSHTGHRLQRQGPPDARELLERILSQTHHDIIIAPCSDPSWDAPEEAR
eukprot:6724435-Pyramimonas_sp.AAC.1